MVFSYCIRSANLVIYSHGKRLPILIIFPGGFPRFI
ncbi:hypothetical protein [Vibrio phage 27Ua.3]|nr:hypothetical protein [Vibrio phage 27Ua.3]